MHATAPSATPPPATPAASRTYLFAGGGTGGHLYPGLAIREQILALDPGARCVFACSTRPLDAEILRAEGVEFEPLPAHPFALHPARLAKFALGWPGSVAAARTLLRRLREGSGGATSPGVEVIAMGGFVAAPCVAAAHKDALPITLVNLDAAPGRANRWAAQRAARTYTACEVAREEAQRSEGMSRWTRVRPIVRAAAVAPGDARDCRARLGLDPDRPVLLVTGASQGARSINEFMLRFIANHTALFARGESWQVLHQTGSQGADDVRRAYEQARIDARVEPFVRDMGLWWGAADCAVSRAGAGSVAEAWANRVPTLFIPYPYHKDDHQRRNAEPLFRAGAAVVVKDLVDAGDNNEQNGPVLGTIMTGEARRAAMRAALHALGPADGAASVARALVTGEEPAGRAGAAGATPRPRVQRPGDSAGKIARAAAL